MSAGRLLSCKIQEEKQQIVAAEKLLFLLGRCDVFSVLGALSAQAFFRKPSLCTKEKIVFFLVDDAF